jgi:hypothetical protein
MKKRTANGQFGDLVAEVRARKLKKLAHVYEHLVSL